MEYELRVGRKLKETDYPRDEATEIITENHRSVCLNANSPTYQDLGASQRPVLIEEA